MAGQAQEPLRISWAGLGLCLLWMGLVSLGASRRLGLGLERQLGVAALRCVVQLSFLGSLLVPIFQARHGRAQWNEGREKRGETVTGGNRVQSSKVRSLDWRGR